MANQEEQLNIKEEVKDTEEQPVVGDTLTPNSEAPAEDVARDEEEQVPVQEDSVAEQPVDEGVADEENSVEEEPVEKMFSQSEVNELMGKTRAEGRNRALSELLERYGVSDDNELNELFGRGQAYDVLNDDYMGVQSQLKDVMGENALLKSGISQDKWDDARAILSYKKLDLTPENIAAELATHPEWKGLAAPDAMGESSQQVITPDIAQAMADKASLNKVKPVTPSTIKVMGNEGKNVTPTDDDASFNKLFNL